MYHCRACKKFFRKPEDKKGIKVCSFCKSEQIDPLNICEICGRAEELDEIFLCKKCRDLITVEVAFAVSAIKLNTGAEKEVIISKIKEMYKE